MSEATEDEVIALVEALETRRILEEIKAVAAIQPPDDMPTPYKAAWQTCCEEIFYRATAASGTWTKTTNALPAHNLTAPQWGRGSDGGL